MGALLVTAVGTALVLTSIPDGKPPEPGSPEELAVGEEVFMANCATCHGDELQGTFVGPPFLDDIYAPDHHPDAAFRQAVANGVRPHHWDFAAMPPVPGLSNDEVDAVIAYVRSVQRANGVGADEDG